MGNGRCTSFRRNVMNKSRIFIFTILFVLFLPVVSVALILGPYTGQVLDSQTGEPIEGASVLIYWEKPVFPAIEYTTDLIKAELVYTDKQGRYEIPKILANIGLLGELDSTNIIIYQPGYQVYTVRISHDSYAKPEKSFKEKDNIVKLDRIPPHFNHKAHYREIEGALRGIDEYHYSYPVPKDPGMTWDKILRINLKGITEKEELLMRAEWEEIRGLSENRR